MDVIGSGIIASLLFLAVVGIVILYLSVRIVRQYERMVIFRLGRTDESLVREPGLKLLIPFVDRPGKGVVSDLGEWHKLNPSGRKTLGDYVD